MNIIPAIDLKKGKVVRANQGDRALYEPIDLFTTYSSNPIAFIKALIIRYKPSTIYLADLDLFGLMDFQIYSFYFFTNS